jgi:hypothetical protein
MVSMICSNLTEASYNPATTDFGSLTVWLLARNETHVRTRAIRNMS